MAAKFKFANEETYQTIDREKLMVFLNVSNDTNEKWAVMGIGVKSGSLSYDWQRESNKDIVGNTVNTMKDPIVSMDMQEWPVAGSDAAQRYILDLAVVQQNSSKLAALDILVVHGYLVDQTDDKKCFAERYNASSIEMSEIGGEGGGNLINGSTVTCGGTRSVGTATVTGTTVDFNAGLE